MTHNECEHVIVAFAVPAVGFALVPATPHHALDGMGFDGVNDVRIGRLIELDVADTVTDEALGEMCEKLLANTVIENYRIEGAE